MSSLLSSNGATNDKIEDLSSTDPLITAVSTVAMNITGSLTSDDAYISALDKIGNQVYLGTGALLFALRDNEENVRTDRSNFI